MFLLELENENKSDSGFFFVFTLSRSLVKSTYVEIHRYLLKACLFEAMI